MISFKQFCITCEKYEIFMDVNISQFFIKSPVDQINNIDGKINYFSNILFSKYNKYNNYNNYNNYNKYNKYNKCKNTFQK
jgi:hypothetical protein